MKSSRAPSPVEGYLQSILDQLDSNIWTIQKIFKALKGKGYPLLIILMSLPFCQPLQIPGFSTPFGIVLIFIGLRMAFGHQIWWPQWVLNQQISTHLLRTIIQKSLGFLHFLNPLIYSRWSWLCLGSFYRVHGGFVILMGLYLALPLPIPFSNLLSAWALFFLGLGLIEDDGLLICISYLLGCTGLILLAFVIGWLHAWIIS